MQLATVENGKVEVSGATVTLIAALITVIPGIVTAATEMAIKPWVQP